MTSKVKGTEGIEFPDSTVQGSAAYTKAQANATFLDQAELIAQFASLMGNNGYTKLPNGIIIQWGRGGIAVAGNGQSVTYPINFPNAVFSLTAQSLAGSTVLAMSVQLIDLNYFNIWASSLTPGFAWIAIGY